MPDDNIDGGETALAGFLYQIVGVLGLAAWTDNRQAPAGSRQLDKLLTVAGRSRLGHEINDQDALLLLGKLRVTDEQTCAIVQFKYSQLSPPKKVGPAEYKQILQRLRDGTNAEGRAGRQVKSYFLVTNRELGPGAAKMRSDAWCGKTNARLDEPQLVNLARLSEIVDNVALTRWIDALHSFAARYGLDRQESERGIHELTGAILHSTIDRAETWITTERLVHAFTRSTAARPLTASAILEWSAPAVEEFRSGQKSQDAIVRRDVFVKAADAAATRALVVLHGPGGCGKTETFRQWAYDLTHRAGEYGACTTISSAHAVEDDWISAVIARWANMSDMPERRRESSDSAIARLERANPALTRTPPILHLGVDGLDDDIVARSDKYCAIARVIDWFWREDQRVVETKMPPRATLIVTHRELERFTSDWLGEHIYGVDEARDDIAHVEIGDFTDEELVNAAENAARGGVLGRGLADRIIATLNSPPPAAFRQIQSTVHPSLLGTFRLGEQTIGAGFVGSNLPTIGTISPYVSPIGRDLLFAFRHPAMWATFIGLGSDWYERVLNGDRDAMGQLCQHYVDRFHGRARRRGHVASLSRVSFGALLHRVAVDTGQGPAATRQRWIEVAYGTGIVDGRGAEELYSEAESWGLISTDSGRWWWRHGFVRSHLTDATNTA